MFPSVLRPERVQELARRSTSNAPNIISGESLAELAKQASELLRTVGMIRPFAQMVLRMYERMEIVSNHDLDLTLRQTRRDVALELDFMQRFNDYSGRN